MSDVAPESVFIPMKINNRQEHERAYKIVKVLERLLTHIADPEAAKTYRGCLKKCWDAIHAFEWSDHYWSEAYWQEPGDEDTTTPEFKLVSTGPNRFKIERLH